MTDYSSSHIFRKGESEKSYPYDAARSYIFKKQNAWGWQDLKFSYHLSKPEGSALVINHNLINLSTLDSYDLKDAAWFEKTSYSDIISYFSRKVIYLIDEQHVNDAKGYLLRVYFWFEAEE